jgi:Ribbon-helix-helix protein, copG family
MRAIRPSNQSNIRLETHRSAVEGLTRLNVQVTHAQYERLRRLAYERNVSLAEVVRQAVEEWLPSQK